MAVEDPGWARLRDAVTSAGLRVHPVPVDHDGVRVEDLARTPARTVVVGAAHQLPTGTVLSPARRAGLVRSAREVTGFVIEDTDTREAVPAAAGTGLSLTDLDDYRARRSPERALVLGYGNIGDTEIPPAVALLGEALAVSTRRRG